MIHFILLILLFMWYIILSFCVCVYVQSCDFYVHITVFIFPSKSFWNVSLLHLFQMIRFSLSLNFTEKANVWILGQFHFTLGLDQLFSKSAEFLPSLHFLSLTSCRFLLLPARDLLGSTSHILLFPDFLIHFGKVLPPVISLKWIYDSEYCRTECVFFPSFDWSFILM